MKKIFFTPFPFPPKGLQGRLDFREGEQQAGKPSGEYRGFKFADRIYAPTKNQTLKRLSSLTEADDQLYINAHCAAGVDFIASKERPTEEDKLKIPKLIEQLDLHGLPVTTQAKIKLFICEGARDNGGNESFAKRFSRALHTAGYHNCFVYAYTECVAANLAKADDEQYHKAAHGKTKRLSTFRQKFYNGSLVPE